MRGDEIVELLNVITLQRFNHGFAFSRIAGVDEHRFPAGEVNQDRVAIDWTNIQHPNS